MFAITYGSRVSFALPSAARLQLVRGVWQYRPQAFNRYEGRVEDIKPHQITVYVASEKKYCVVHPDMCSPI